MAEEQHDINIPTAESDAREEEKKEREERRSNLLTDILTIVGFAILFIIIIWGLVHLVQLIASSYSSSKPAASIQVDAPAQATSGQPVVISWKYSPATAGSYAFLYQCKDGLTFQTSAAKDSGIPCGIAFTIGGASSSVSIVPVLSATSSVDDTVSIVFIPKQGGSQVQGNATITVNPAAAEQPATPAKKTTSYTPKSYTYTGTHNSGPADLSVRIISGNINGGVGTVTFDIANIGGSTSGSYTFSAQLPTMQPYPYSSPIQAPLSPGSHIVSTLNFTDAAPNGGLFSVSILNGNDANASNDYATMQLSGSGYNYNPAPYTQYPAYTY